MNKQDLENVLAGSPVQSIYAFDSISSTNDFALERLGSQEDVPDWTLVIADTQTAGRGRLNRKWVTEPGAGLAFTLIFRANDFEKGHINLFSPLAALAVSEALEEGYSLRPAIKWPNDVLLNGMKTCGILAETSWRGDVLPGLVLGIGVNIKPGAIPPPEMLLFPATCVENEAGRPVERMDILRRIILSLGEWRERLGSKEFFSAWESRLAFKGEWVRIERPAGDHLTGKVVGISADGCLRLLSEKEEEVLISVGDVRLRPAENYPRHSV